MSEPAKTPGELHFEWENTADKEWKDLDVEQRSRWERSALRETEYQAKCAEEERVDRWHATYNAVLEIVPCDIVAHAAVVDAVHQAAAAQADRAHGPLVKP